MQILRLSATFSLAVRFGDVYWRLYVINCSFVLHLLLTLLQFFLKIGLPPTITALLCITSHILQFGLFGKLVTELYLMAVRLIFYVYYIRFYMLLIHLPFGLSPREGI